MSGNPQAQKAAAAEAALDYIKPHMKLGLGTGSTAEILVQRLAQKVETGLVITAAVPTSARTAELAASFGLPVVGLDASGPLDLCIDGADEVDPHLNLIKGGGGALLREKIVASASAQRVIMVDSSKPVDVLGAFGVPVEIVPFAVSVVRRSLEKMGAQTELRSQGDSNAPFRTDENNFIVDCAFGDIPEPAALALRLSTIAGVVDHGLFCAMTEVVLIGGPNGVETRTRAAAGEPADP